MEDVVGHLLPKWTKKNDVRGIFLGRLLRATENLRGKREISAHITSAQLLPLKWRPFISLFGTREWNRWESTGSFLNDYYAITKIFTEIVELAPCVDFLWHFNERRAQSRSRKPRVIWCIVGIFHFSSFWCWFRFVVIIRNSASCHFALTIVKKD